MALWDRFAKKRDAPKEDETPIPVGRMTGQNNVKSSLSPIRSRTSNILSSLRGIKEEVAAIEFLRKVNPDVSMAVWNFVRLANQGNQMEFYTVDGKKKLTDLESLWREFAARVNEISNSGLDGLIDVMHHSAYMYGAMGIEVEVAQGLTDIVDIYPVKPNTITWELEEREGKKMWIPYQSGNMKKVSLEKGKANFFWVPTDPDIDDPRGNLLLSPVLQAVDFQMQILEDLQAVLHHQGYPRNDIAINLERMMLSVPPGIKNNPKKVQEWLNSQWENIRKMFAKIQPEDDYLHFDDIVINMNQGANSQRSLDVRAITELVDVQTMSGTKQMAIFMNRNQGVTESWGTVQFKIFCSGIASIQRGSKRMIEEIARLWLRVNGIQAVPKFTHNLVDWESEKARYEVNLLKETFYQVAQQMGWISPDMPASELFKQEKAFGEPYPNMTGKVQTPPGGGNKKE